MERECPDRRTSHEATGHSLDDTLRWEKFDNGFVLKKLNCPSIASVFPTYRLLGQTSTGWSWSVKDGGGKNGLPDAESAMIAATARYLEAQIYG